MAALSAGDRLGPYEIVSPIGAGGMGEVYKARDSRLDRAVALKILPDTLASDRQFRERFDREARAISQLTHPHICTLFDVGEQAGIAFLVMEYLEGETLEQRLKKGPVPIADALRLAIQIADALSAAHRHGIVHRDLKPGNVMLTKTGAKLLDFGLAKTSATGIAPAGVSMLPTTPPNLTQHGAILGTFQYMAPEQLEGEDADARSDIFAFGALLHEMLTGRPAFEGRTPASLMAAILERQPPPISTLTPGAPPLLAHVVQRCVAKNPDARWQSMADVRSELEWIAELAATAPGGLGTAATSTTPGTRDWKLITIGVLGVAVISLALTWFMRSSTNDRLRRLDILTPATDDSFSFALSPDGQQLTFVASGPSGPELWLRPLDQVTARPIAGTEGGNFPFWDPNSRAIGFFADGKLKLVDLAGGAPVVLADAPTGRGGAWSAEGTIVFTPTTTSGLMRVPARGGVATSLTQLGPGQGSHRWPQFLPDGRHLLYMTALGQPDTRGTYVVSIAGGQSARLLPGEIPELYASGYLLSISSGTLFAQPFDPARLSTSGEPIAIGQDVGADPTLARTALSAARTGMIAYRAGTSSKRTLVWVDRTGTSSGSIFPPDENAPSNPELAFDDQRIAFNRTTQGNGDIWVLELKHGVLSRLTLDPAIDVSPVWSPDARQIVFRSLRNGHADLFVKAADNSSDERPLLVDSQDKEPLQYSPDGQFLLYAVQEAKSGPRLWVLPLMGDRKPFPVAPSSSDAFEGQFSPDGKWLAYVSNESGPYQIYVRAFPGEGARWPVSSNGGSHPRWSRDGKELFYMAPDDHLMAVPTIAEADGRTLKPDRPKALFRLRLATGANILPAGFAARPQYAVARDGRFLALVAADAGPLSPITIALNWETALRK